jgi:BMFP domain-containing protein YqiC
MTNQQANDLFASLKTYINKVSEGEKTPQEIAASLNTWARESAESLKSKISEEVETQVHKLGFVKREEFDSLVARVAALDGQKSKVSKKTTAKKTVKKAAKKSPAKKVAKKSASRKAK